MKTKFAKSHDPSVKFVLAFLFFFLPVAEADDLYKLVLEGLQNHPPIIELPEYRCDRSELTGSQYSRCVYTKEIDHAVEQFAAQIPKASSLQLDFVETKGLDPAMPDSKDVQGKFFDVYKSTGHPIYLLHFKEKKLYSAMFERIGNFIEDRITGAALEFHLYRTPPPDGEDFNAEDLARFFNYMAKSKYRLNSLEEHLKENLVNAKILSIDDKGILKSRAQVAVLATTRDSSEGSIRHEINHGVYFTDPQYRGRVSYYWNSLDPMKRAFVETTLKRISNGSFNPKLDKDLFIREFAAIFRDREVLLRDYFDHAGRTHEVLQFTDEIARGLISIEQTTSFYTGGQTNGDAPAAAR